MTHTLLRPVLFQVLGGPGTTAQVHPFKLTNALMDAAVASVGAHIVTGTVTGVEIVDNKVTGTSLLRFPSLGAVQEVV